MNALRYAACVMFAAFCATANADFTVPPVAKEHTSTIADWTLQTTAEMQRTYTLSNTGASFGVFCLLQTNSCIVYLGTGTPCAEGTVSPLLMNASTGAASLNAICAKLSNDQGQPVFVYRISEMDICVKGAEAGGDFGIALPLTNGQFVVYRFSGRGATDAINAARTRPASAPTPAKAGGDQVL
jgi:hypothetical protein